MMNNKEKNFVSAVLYCYNCQDSVGAFLKNINLILAANFEKYEIICVNDSSTDDTVKEIHGFCEQEKVNSLSLVTTSFFQGLENAMIAGNDMAIGDFVFEFDSTCNDFNGELVMEVYKKSLQGFDIVFAVPEKGVKASSKLFYSLFNQFSHTQYQLKTQRFSLISRRGINRVKSMGVKTVYRKAVYASCGLMVCDLFYQPQEIKSVPDHQKKSKKELAVNSLILFTDIAYKISLSLTIAMAGILLIAGVYTLAIFFSANPVAGWTTTMLVMSFGFFGLFVILGFVLKYLSVILNLIFSHKQYTLESVQKITK